MAKLAGGCWILGWVIAAFNHNVYLTARYHIEKYPPSPRLVAISTYERCEYPQAEKSITINIDYSKKASVILCFEAHQAANAPFKGDGRWLIPFGVGPFSPEQKKAIEDATARLKKDPGNPTEKNPFELYGALNEYNSDEVIQYMARVADTFLLSSEDERKIKSKWWSIFRDDYSSGIVYIFWGLTFLWVFTSAVGWIMRGFMGIPRGSDEKP
jgi:hypothetical protein